MKIAITENKSALGKYIADILSDAGHSVSVLDYTSSTMDAEIKEFAEKTDIDLLINNNYLPSSNELSHIQYRICANFLDIWSKTMLKYVINIVDICAVKSHTLWEGDQQYRKDQVMFNIIEQSKSNAGNYPNSCVMYMDKNASNVEDYADIILHMVSNCKEVWASKLVITGEQE